MSSHLFNVVNGTLKVIHSGFGAFPIFYRYLLLLLCHIFVYDSIFLINAIVFTIQGAKKLPCNHIFHVSCLRSWFQRQQTCPTCRLNVLRVATPPTPQPPRNMPEFNQFGFGQGPMFQGPVGQQPHNLGMWGGVPPWAQQQVPQQPQQGSLLFYCIKI